MKLGLYKKKVINYNLGWVFYVHSACDLPELCTSYQMRPTWKCQTALCLRLIKLHCISWLSYLHRMNNGWILKDLLSREIYAAKRISLWGWSPLKKFTGWMTYPGWLIIRSQRKDGDAERLTSFQVKLERLLDVCMWDMKFFVITGEYWEAHAE